jgi:hypothetical protein
MQTTNLGTLLPLHYTDRFSETTATSAKPKPRSKRLDGSGTTCGGAKMVVESTPAMRELPIEGSNTAVKLPPMFRVAPPEKVMVIGKIVPVRVALSGVCVSYTRVSKKKVEPSPADPSEYVLVVPSAFVTVRFRLLNIRLVVTGKRGGRELPPV